MIEYNNRKKNIQINIIYHVTINYLFFFSFLACKLI